MKCLLLSTVKFATNVQNWVTAVHIMNDFSTDNWLGDYFSSFALLTSSRHVLVIDWNASLNILLQLWCMLWRFWQDNAVLSNKKRYWNIEIPTTSFVLEKLMFRRLLLIAISPNQWLLKIFQFLNWSEEKYSSQWFWKIWN